MVQCSPYSTRTGKEKHGSTGTSPGRGLFELSSFLKGTFTQRGQAPVVVGLPLRPLGVSLHRYRRSPMRKPPKEVATRVVATGLSPERAYSCSPFGHNRGLSPLSRVRFKKFLVRIVPPSGLSRWCNVPLIRLEQAKKNMARPGRARVVASSNYLRS